MDGQTDGQTDVGHINLIGGLVTRNPPKNFPGLLHTSGKYEKNPPYGCKAIAKRNCGSGGVASPIYKQESLAGRLIILTQLEQVLAMVLYNSTDCLLSRGLDIVKKCN